MEDDTSQEMIQFRWVPDTSATVAEVENVATALRERGADAEIEEATNLFGVGEVGLIIFAFMGIVKLADAVSDFLKNATRSGVIIDTRTQPITIRDVRSLDHGVVIVISKSGEQSTLQDSRREDKGALLKLFASLAKNQGQQ